MSPAIACKADIIKAALWIAQGSAAHALENARVLHAALAEAHGASMLVESACPDYAALLGMADAARLQMLQHAHA